MKRVKIAFLGKQSDDELVEILTWQQCFLCIVNTRPHAARLYEQLTRAVAGDPRIFHLSTFMCGAHRSDVLTAIRALLSKGKPCRVISTQLIEAGVDVDFPLVYRALTGIDSIAQAAGRCNREGRLREGIVYVFEPSNVRLQGYLRSVAESAAEVLEDTGDLLSPETVRRYFELHYWKQSGGNRWDDSRIMDCFPTPPHKLQFQYKTAANSFQFIESAGKPVLVPYGTTGRQLIERLRAIGPCRDLLRKLQRYTVAVFEHSYDSMLGTDIELLDSGHAVLLNAECYDARLGFRARQAGQHEPETLIC